MSTSKNVTIVAREGYGHIVLAFVPFAVSVYGDFYALFTYLFFFLFIFSLVFFRNPERVVADDTSGSVLSPVDGVVEAIERLEDESGVRVRIGNGMFDTHILRAPCKSTVGEVTRRHGMAIFNSDAKAEYLNASCRVSFDGIRMQMVGAFFPYEAACYFESGDTVRHGERIGFLYTGYVELILPYSVNLHINLGDQLKSAESLIGIIKE
jgi:phosphatidylserine decarboxylase